MLSVASISAPGWRGDPGCNTRMPILPDFGTLIIPCFFFGFTLQYFAQVIGAWPETRLAVIAPAFEAIAHALATPLIAGGYVCTLVLLFNHRSTQWLVRPFAPVGQMALTNYLMQSVFIVFILTGNRPRPRARG